ncbi:hypothetical protein [Actinomycetospora straminea]|uniref:hypothetical protein n=1 Tax=Actinomycetospora straminea TaxID=663607 RepID=UPI0023651C4F|nr:hypothetical protein [Actinomycetospora straminea]MDD7931945.1 hypothetical protein [Actinomycetospora straminea]
MIIEARTVVDGPVVVVPAPRTPPARPVAAPPAPVRAAGERGPDGHPEDHPDVIAARLVSQAAVVSSVGRLVLLLALGLATLVVLL